MINIIIWTRDMGCYSSILRRGSLAGRIGHVGGTQCPEAEEELVTPFFSRHPLHVLVFFFIVEALQRFEVWCGGNNLPTTTDWRRRGTQRMVVSVEAVVKRCSAPRASPWRWPWDWQESRYHWDGESSMDGHFQWFIGGSLSALSLSSRGMEVHLYFSLSLGH
jgi:hypothetical protein